MLFFTPTLAALSTGHQIGLACVGAAFILFALICSFVLPRFNPNFPGRGMGAYIAICVLFFVAMLAAVLVFGKEKTEPAEAAQTTTGQSAPPPKTTTSSGAAAGNPTAGKAVFASAGCASCHTLKAANSHGLIGPNLDQLKPAEATVVHQVENGGGAMPAFKGTLSPTQIQDVAAFVYTSTH